MARLLVHVEGETEETFVNEVLGPYLYGRGFQTDSGHGQGESEQENFRSSRKP